ncbi:hypothetical protein [Martelella lutilitoris]|nr:hypothetical protein [Martelella lutilitoris]
MVETRFIIDPDDTQEFLRLMIERFLELHRGEGKPEARRMIERRSTGAA